MNLREEIVSDKLQNSKIEELLTSNQLTLWGFGRTYLVIATKDCRHSILFLLYSSIHLDQVAYYYHIL